MSPVEAAIEAELDLWRAARAQQALIEGRWGAPPGIPVQTDGRVVLDPTGRYALLIGYRAVHLLDLHTALTRLLVSDARSDREGAFSPDGRHAVVTDGYGERLHWITLDGEPRAEQRAWSCPRALRGEHALVLGDDGLLAVVGRDIDDAPLRAQWVDGPSGAVKHSAKVGAEQHGATCAVADVRFTGRGAALHIRLTDPAGEAIEIEPETPQPRRVPAVFGGSGHGRWRLVEAGARRQLTAGGSSTPIDIPRPREALCVGAGRAALAAAVDGRAQVYDTRTGQPIGGRLTPPGRARFGRVDQLLLTDDRLWLAGVAPSSPFSDAEVPLLAGWRLDGADWRPLGVVLLADRTQAPRERGAKRRERMSNVYVKGVQLTVAQLEAKGITFVGDKKGEEAQDRFARPHDDPYPRELPFARTASGVFGRLDADRPIGVEAAAPFERPALARALLLDDAPTLDDATRAALDDWRARLDFWRTQDLWSKPDALRRLMDASAGLGDLLPEIVHRAPTGKSGRPPAAGTLSRIAERMHRPDANAREDTVFREMLARERRRLLPEMLRRRLQVTCPSLSETDAAQAAELLGTAIEPLADAAETGATTLSLTDVEHGAALVDLLVAARPDLRLEHLDLSGSALDDRCIERLFAAEWPGLTALDLSRTALTDRGALTLACAPGLPDLVTLALNETAVTVTGRAALRWSPTLPALRDPLPLPAGWAGLLALDGVAPAVHGAMIEALWRATLDHGAAVESAGARVECTAAPDPQTLTVAGIPVAPAAIDALAACALTPHLSRLTLRACDLDDRAAPPLLRLAATLSSTAQLDLSDNRLGADFALALARAAADGGPGWRLSNNPIDPFGWGALRGALPGRVHGAPEAPVEQLAALAQTDRAPLDARGAWIGEALAAEPALAEPLLAHLGEALDPEARKTLLPHLSAAATRDDANGDVWRALAAHGLDLAVDGPTRWWLGDVGCSVEDGRLRLRPQRALSDRWLRIEAEPDGSRLRKLFDGQDVLTGDPAFDRAALISGEPGMALALLDATVRAALLPRLGQGLVRGVTLIDGVLELPVPADPAAVVTLAGTAARLALPASPLPELWAERLADEQTSESALLLARALLADPPPPLALLDRAAESPVEDARRLVGRALAARLDDAAIADLGPAGCAAALEEAPGGLRPALIARLRAIGDERAVAPLTRLADAFFGSGEVKKAARAAVEAIIERQGGLRAGGLTMVGDGPTGGLTVAESEEG